MNKKLSEILNPINKWVDIEMANDVLLARINRIRTVAKWAEYMNYESINEFRLNYKLYFGKSCKEAMVEIRLNLAIELIKNSDMKLFIIAQQVGLCTEFALYKYFMRHLGKSPSFFKTKRTMNFFDL